MIGGSTTGTIETSDLSGSEYSDLCRLLVALINFPRLRSFGLLSSDPIAFQKTVGMWDISEWAPGGLEQIVVQTSDKAWTRFNTVRDVDDTESPSGDTGNESGKVKKVRTLIQAEEGEIWADEGFVEGIWHRGNRIINDGDA